MPDFPEDIEKEYTEPQKYNKLFTSYCNDLKHSSYLGFTRNELICYADGYKKAGDILVENIVAGAYSDDRNTLIYPIVFLYRHCIELYLKSIIYEGNQLLFGKPVAWREHHDINKLWIECRTVLENLWPEASREPLENIDTCLKEFFEVDPNSFSFRYHVKKRDDEDKKDGKPIGKPSLPNLTTINVKHLSEVVDEIYEILSGSSIAISEARSSMWNGNPSY